MTRVRPQVTKLIVIETSKSGTQGGFWIIK